MFEPSFADKKFLAMRLALNEMAGRGKFPMAYVEAAWKHYAELEEGDRGYGWGLLLMMAQARWKGKVRLINVTRPGERVKMAVEVLEYLEPIKS